MAVLCYGLTLFAMTCGLLLEAVKPISRYVVTLRIQ